MSKWVYRAGRNNQAHRVGQPQVLHGKGSLQVVVMPVPRSLDQLLDPQPLWLGGDESREARGHHAEEPQQPLTAVLDRNCSRFHRDAHPVRTRKSLMIQKRTQMHRVAVHFRTIRMEPSSLKRVQRVGERGQ